MFPSSGYFRGINCPYFISGLCDRPYCHFRHVKSDGASSSSRTDVISSATTYRSSSQPAHTKERKKCLDQKQPMVVEYRPTPIHLLKSRTAACESEYDPVKNYSSSSTVSGYTASVKRSYATYGDTDVITKKQKFDKDLIGVSDEEGDDVSAESTIFQKNVESHKSTIVQSSAVSDESDLNASVTINCNDDMVQLPKPEERLVDHTSAVGSTFSKYSDKNINPEKMVSKASLSIEKGVLSKSTAVNRFIENKLTDARINNQELRPREHSSTADVCLSVESVLKNEMHEDNLTTGSNITHDVYRCSENPTKSSSHRTIPCKNSDVKLKSGSHREQSVSCLSSDMHEENSQQKKQSSQSRTRHSPASHEVSREQKKKSVQVPSGGLNNDKISVDKTKSLTNGNKSSASHTHHSASSHKLVTGQSKSSIEKNHFGGSHDKETVGKTKSLGTTKSTQSHTHSSTKIRSDNSHERSSHKDTHSVDKNKSSTKHKSSKNHCNIGNAVITDVNKRPTSSSSLSTVERSVDNGKGSLVGEAQLKTHTGHQVNSSKYSSLDQKDHSKTKTHVSATRTSRDEHSTSCRKPLSSKSSDTASVFRDKKQVTSSSSSSSLSKKHAASDNGKILSKPLATDMKGLKHDAHKKQIVRAVAVRNVELFGEDSDTDSVCLDTRNSQNDQTDEGPAGEKSRAWALAISEDSSDSFDSAMNTFEQCQQIYSDFSRQLKSSSDSIHKSILAANKVVKAKETEEMSSNIKKRLAHVSSTDSIPAKRLELPSKKRHLTPSQQMLSRIEALKKTHLSSHHQEESVTDVKPTAVVSSSIVLPSSLKTVSSSAVASKRIAHTPSTSQGTRLAHIPSKVILERPILAPDSSSKVPINVRQFQLNRFFEECCKVYDDQKDASERALSEEKLIYERSSTKPVYINLAIHTIRRIREEVPGGTQPISPFKQKVRTLSHEAVLGGPKATCTSFTVNRSSKLPSVPDKFNDSELYQRLKRYILTDAQLNENGFPRPNDSSPGTVRISVSQLEKNHVPLSSSNPDEKICCRCGKRFVILPDGSFPIQEKCIYHWGKSWKKRIAGSIENSYTCCQGDLNSKGCQVAQTHVHERNKYSSLSGYMKTLPSSSASASFGVFALDCEMIYTTEGSELARVTVINSELESIYETLVRPEHPVLDYNTRFSGITRESLASVKVTLRDVQAVLLSIFNEKSILIGHSLESDFIALKLAHSTVVDTSVVFPHRLGLPYKRALKNLAGEILQRIIQNDVGGHDSAEDAQTCMELMLYRVKEDAKRELRR